MRVRDLFQHMTIRSPCDCCLRNLFTLRTPFTPHFDKGNNDMHADDTSRFYDRFDCVHWAYLDQLEHARFVQGCKGFTVYCAVDMQLI
jgi:hypothetical protein